MEVEDTLRSLSRLSDKIWFENALDQRNAGKCMDLFRVYCIGRQFMTEGCAVIITFFFVWNLLNFWRSVSSGYKTQIAMDVTYKCSTAAEHVEPPSMSRHALRPPGKRARFLKNVLDISTMPDARNRHCLQQWNTSKILQSDEKYVKFCAMLCDIMLIACEAGSYYLQSLLVQWLRANVDDQCDAWFETHWTGPVKGRYLLGSDGLVSNNQSLESAGGGIAMQALLWKSGNKSIKYLSNILQTLSNRFVHVKFLRKDAMTKVGTSMKIWKNVSKPHSRTTSLPSCADFFFGAG